MFGHIARGDVDDVRKDLQKVLSGKVKMSAVNVAFDEGEEDFAPPKRHQVVKLTVYSEPVYALLDTGAIPNVMSLSSAKKLKFDIFPTAQRIIVANGTKRWLRRHSNERTCWIWRDSCTTLVHGYEQASL